MQKRFALTDNEDDHYYFSLGLAGYIGKKKVIKGKHTPIISVITPPKDSDGDGILDIDDACPQVPGVAKYKGCPIPDRDGDGINDEEDKCPDVPGILRYAGCPIPDRDGDGINDEVDQCPDVPGLARYFGCPIPDRDGDGLNDEIDDCPDKPGPVSNKGCPLVSAEVVKRINLAAKNCFFETGKYRLLPKSYKALNEVVLILKSDTALTLLIEGHTDNIGKEHENQLLSENRAKSVLNYLVDKGVQIRRLHSEGFGQSKPVSTNSTSEGRSRNRRVEMKLSTTAK
jgi:outer membrane protein OmpA-like peptidoglycan-associated protein